MLESVLKASCLPLSFLLFVPAVLLLLGPPPAAEAAHEFTVYRMQQYELGGQPYGERERTARPGAVRSPACGRPRSCGRENASGGFLEGRRGPGESAAAGKEPRVGPRRCRRPREGDPARGRATQRGRARRRAWRTLGGRSRACVRAQTEGRPQVGPVWLSLLHSLSTSRRLL